MPLPLVPVAGAAVAAYAAFSVWRAARPARIDQRAEDALDDTDEGIGLVRARDGDQTNASARLRRVIRLGSDGPGVEIDAALLGRFRLRRV